MNSREWADLYGEEPEGTVSDWLAGAKAAAERNKGRVFCKRCQDFIHLDEMRIWRADDDTIRHSCPGCDTELMEPE